MKIQSFEKGLTQSKIDKRGSKSVISELFQTNRHLNRGFHRPITKMFLRKNGK